MLLINNALRLVRMTNKETKLGVLKFQQDLLKMRTIRGEKRSILILRKSFWKL